MSAFCGGVWNLGCLVPVAIAVLTLVLVNETARGLAPDGRSQAMKNEPVVVICGAIAPLVTAVLALLLAFGVDVTQAQTAAILGVVAVPIGVVSALVARSKVTPMNRVRSLRRPEHGQSTPRLLVVVVAVVFALWALIVAAGSKVVILLALAVIALAGALIL